jgi:hypothetical protein
MQGKFANLELNAADRESLTVLRLQGGHGGGVGVALKQK